MATIKKSKGYLGNQNLKQENEIVEITFDQQQEYAMCMIDPIYFITKYVKIVSLDHGIVPFQLYEYQKRFIMAMHENRKVIGMMPRQMGKTTTAAAYLCWYLLFSENEAVTVAILANKASAAREIMSRLQQMYEALPKWMQKGVKEWNKGSIELASGARAFTAATSASGIRGKSVNFLYIDEAAIIPNNVADEFFTSTYPTISAGETTKIVLTSTPLGLNHFWKYWVEAEQKINGFVPIDIHYSEHPKRDQKWADEQEKLLGTLKFRQEVLCVAKETKVTIRYDGKIQTLEIGELSKILNKSITSS